MVPEKADSANALQSVFTSLIRLIEIENNAFKNNDLLWEFVIAKNNQKES